MGILTRQEEDDLRRAYEYRRDPFMRRQIWLYHQRGAELERAAEAVGRAVPGAERYPDAVPSGFWPEIMR